jgi:hypothetical protein
VLAKPDDLGVTRAVEREVMELAAGFPLFAREPVVRPDHPRRCNSRGAE